MISMWVHLNIPISALPPRSLFRVFRPRGISSDVFIETWRHTLLPCKKTTTWSWRVCWVEADGVDTSWGRRVHPPKKVGTTTINRMEVQLTKTQWFFRVRISSHIMFHEPWSSEKTTTLILHWDHISAFFGCRLSGRSPKRCPGRPGWTAPEMGKKGSDPGTPRPDNTMVFCGLFHGIFKIFTSNSGPL